MRELIKRITLVAVAAVGVVACSQSDLEDGVITPDSTTESTTESTTQPFVLYASTPSDLETKIAFTENEADGSIDLAWEYNDCFAIYNNEGIYVGNVYCTSTEDGKFEALSSAPITLNMGDSYTALYPAPSSSSANYTLTLDEIIATQKSDITSQLDTPTVNKLSSSCLMLAEFTYAGEEDTSIKFAHQMAIMTINFKSALKPDHITFNDGAGTTYTAQSFTANEDEDGTLDGTFTAHLLINPCDGDDRTLIFSLYKETDSNSTYNNYCFDFYKVTSSVVYEAGRRYTADVTSLAESPWDGAGTAEDPYLIEDGDDLRRIATKVSEGKTFLSEYFQMTKDIDLNNEAFTAIGTSSAPFAGSFDGDNHSISGLYINSGSSYQALFGCIKAANSPILITNLSVSGSVSGYDYVGGIIGYSNYYTIVLNCSSSVTVTGRRYVGGIAGYIELMSIFYCCYNTGQITATEESSDAWAGGILGYCAGSTDDAPTQVISCYNTGAVSGSCTVGGIAGTFNASMVVLCHNTGAVSGIHNTGGICGVTASGSYVMSCYNRGKVSASATGSYTGGIAGTNSSTSTISDCYYDSTVLTGSSAIGKDNSSSSENVGGKSTSNMKDASFLELLNTDMIIEADMGLWTSDTDSQLNSGYPVLDWQVDGYDEDYIMDLLF